MKKLVICITLLLNVSISSAQCLRSAPFLDGPDYPLNGNATLEFLLDGTKTLNFDTNFSTTSGPDLHVYLSEFPTVSTPGGVLETPNTIDLGLLKSASGSQSYDLSAIDPSITIGSFGYVIIHCKQYNHYWGTGTFASESGVDCANLSVSDFEEDSFSVYPTVVSDNQFTVKLKNNQKASLFLYSVLGELVQKPLTLTQEINVINTSTQTKGMYVLKLDFGNLIRTQKIIIK